MEESIVSRDEQKTEKAIEIEFSKIYFAVIVMVATGLFGTCLVTEGFYRLFAALPVIWMLYCLWYLPKTNLAAG